MAIEWDHIGQPLFDRVVEALVHRLYDQTARVRAVNGRGGDGGIDIEVVSGGRLRIFQLKYYPDGFPSSSFKGRQASIKRSFARAMAHDPYEWVLVVPCTLGPNERAFVDGLAAGRGVRVRVMDRAELDDRLATHPGLVDFFTRDQLLEKAKVFNQEKAVLLGGERDLAERVAALGTVVDALDDNWTVDFSRVEGMVVHTLRAKHPRAHEVSPVTVELKGRPGGMGADLSAALSRTLGFGLAEQVVLPAEAIASLTVTGPQWLAKTLTDVQVTWRPAGPLPGAGAPAELVFSDEAGATVASFTGRLNGLGRGSMGRSIDVDLHGCRLKLLLPHDRDRPAKLNFSFDLAGATPAQALKRLGLRHRLMSGGTFALTVDGKDAGGGQLPAQGAAERDELEQLRLYAQDLEVLQRHCEQEFPLPDDITSSERIALRAARLVVEGHCVIAPFAWSLTFTLNGDDHAVLRAVLGGEPQSLLLTQSEFALSLAGRTLRLGTVLAFHTQVVADDGPAALAALDAGQAEGHRVRMRPVDGQRFRFCLDTVDPHRRLVPTPLGLPGYPEPH
ncbi:hypothetical protein ACFYXS_39400 [Streptomyces sp. NPDC002574]|uniref:hypothetical protein n=1 Tax=Streptomyces sp. NPDC002574 TaxID=3364652 RepID=UPI0036A7960E